MSPPMPPSPPSDALRATAFHEAGHAVVALALGRPVHRVSVRPSMDRLGQCEFKKGRQKPTDDWLEDEVLISLAGMAAEARATGVYERGGAARDLRFARSLMLQRASERTLDRVERRMLAKVENLLGDPGHWLAVERVAADLLAKGTISGRQAVHLFEQAGRDIGR